MVYNNVKIVFSHYFSIFYLLSNGLSTVQLSIIVRQKKKMQMLLNPHKNKLTLNNITYSQMSLNIIITFPSINFTLWTQIIT